jgi:DNA repair exonuclease SbcCD ATPase subunit
MINLIKLNNFQLFPKAEYTLDKITAITGVNYDDLELSSNGSGKTTLAKNAITFCLYGDVAGIVLKDLISLRKKECSVEIQFSDNLRIIRKVPSSLQIFVDNQEVQFNTLALKQQWIDEHFGNYDQFKKYRLIDTKGINLLDLGIISLRKELMQFVDDLFTDIRKRLLEKKLERETYNVDKRIYKYSLSEKKLNTLINAEQQLITERQEHKNAYEEQQRTLNKLNAEFISIAKQLDYKTNEFEKLHKGVCPYLNSKCKRLIDKAVTIQDDAQAEIYKLTQDRTKLAHEIKDTEDCMKHYKELYEFIQTKERNRKMFEMKLQEAFKFKDYKYTAKDVLLYTEAIKTLDDFSGHYINEWLAQLALIINDLLKNVNMQVEFSAEKDFIKIINEKNELKYDMLSSGQKTFLSAIFKLALLIHRGENNGIIIADEGLGNLDAINLQKFISILQNLNFQVIFVYQNLPEINNIKTIKVIREQNESQIKEC